MDEPIFYLNGSFVPQSRALLSILDLGIVRGYGVFDYLITYGRKPFHLSDHLQRLIRSAGMIGVDMPWDEKQLTELVMATLEKNPCGEKSIRLIVTEGESFDLYTPGFHPTLAIIVLPSERYPREYYERGAKVITFQARREIPKAKTLNYILGVRALIQAKKVGAVEALYASQDSVYEGVSSSFFSVKDGVVITASRDTLESVTRKVVLGLIKDKYLVELRDLKTTEVVSADEAFLASSNREVMPVTMINDTPIGDGTPGRITRDIMNLFRRYTTQYSSQ